MLKMAYFITFLGFSILFSVAIVSASPLYDNSKPDNVPKETVSINRYLNMIKQNYYADDELAEVYYMAIIDAIKSRVEIDEKQLINDKIDEALRTRLQANQKPGHLFDGIRKQLSLSKNFADPCVQKTKKDFDTFFLTYRRRFATCHEDVIAQGISYITDFVELADLPLNEQEMTTHIAPCVVKNTTAEVDRCITNILDDLFKPVDISANLADGQAGVRDTTKQIFKNIEACGLRMRNEVFSEQPTKQLTDQAYDCAVKLISKYPNKESV